MRRSVKPPDDVDDPPFRYFGEPLAVEPIAPGQYHVTILNGYGQEQMLRLEWHPEHRPADNTGRLVPGAWAWHLERAGYHLDRFDAYLGLDLIATSRQPLYDGARMLHARGVDPAALLTMRHHDRDYDGFTPRPIGELAEWTIEESDRGGLRRRKWRAFPGGSIQDSAGADQAAKVPDAA